MRNHHERREETKAVKIALKAAGINSRVGHGRGTAWGWLHVEVGTGASFGDHIEVDHYGCCQDRPNCHRCQMLCRLDDETLEIVKKVTGRDQPREYDGNINIYTQDDDVRQPNWKPGREIVLTNGEIEGEIEG